VPGLLPDGILLTIRDPGKQHLRVGNCHPVKNCYPVKECCPVSVGGTTMQLVPRPVDIAVTRPIGESLLGRDSQLDVAVKELLQQLGASTSNRQPRQQP
jgi:hypothetical protein